MTDGIRSTLTGSGANFNNGRVIDFGNSEKEIMHALEHSAISFLQGTDCFVLQSENAKRWCNGMFTNNIRKLQPGHGNRSAICNDRGHVQGFIDVYCIDDESFFCSLDGIDREWFSQRFKMYMILDDIELVDPAYRALHLHGPEAADLLGKFLSPPKEGHDHIQFESIRIASKKRYGNNGFDLFVPEGSFSSWWQKIVEQGAQPVGSDALNTLRILNGRARWPEDGNDKSFVHDLGANEECCAFDKGCYVGQEIINRIDVKGLTNRKLFRIDLEDSIDIGAQVFKDGKCLGTLSSFCRYEGKNYGLAILRKEGWEPGTPLLLKSENTEVKASTMG